MCMLTQNIFDSALSFLVFKIRFCDEFQGWDWSKEAPNDSEQINRAGLVHAVTLYLIANT